MTHANIQTLKEKKECAIEKYTLETKVSQFTAPPSAFPLPSIAINFFIINYSCVFVSAAWSESQSGGPVGVLCC